MAGEAEGERTLNGRGESEAPEAAMTIGLTQAAFAAEAVEVRKIDSYIHTLKLARFSQLGRITCRRAKVPQTHRAHSVVLFPPALVLLPRS